MKTSSSNSMKFTALLFTLALATSAFAGSPVVSSKNAKGPVAPLPEPTCGCFGPGFTFDVGGAAIFDREGQDALGGTVGVNYFFNRNIGLSTSYSLLATHSEHHEFDGNLILRAPIDSLCIAPYALAGGGYSTNGTSGGNYDVGGGLDIRFSPKSCLGIFAEGAYHWAAAGSDYTTVRLGLRIPF